MIDSNKLKEAYASERAKEMASYRALSFTLKEIGEIFGLTRERVRQILQEYGYQKPETPKGPATRACLQCGQRYARREYRAHVETSSHGFGTNREPDPQVGDAMVEDYLLGMSPDEIAKKYGKADTAVYRYMKRRGIKPRWGVGRYPRSDAWREAARVRMIATQAARKAEQARILNPNGETSS